MEKRLTRTEMLFSLGFIFMLVVAVGAFFVGLQVGADRTEAKYVPSKKLNAEADVKVTAYQQQDLVSFYHTVFSPYREFSDQWVAEIDKMKAGLSTEPGSKLKELSALANKQYAEASQSAVSAASPLLVEAQTNLLRSLKLFAQTAERHYSKADSITAGELIAAIGADAYYHQALEYSLLAQKQYYDAMMKWGASLNPDIPAEFQSAGMMEISTWKAQPLVVKNKLMADQLASRNLLTGYYPQDLVARVDQFISSGQASNMKIQTVAAVVDLLLSTDAVRSGDFQANKSRYYSKELLPQLPFFIS